MKKIAFHLLKSLLLVSIWVLIDFIMDSKIQLKREYIAMFFVFFIAEFAVRDKLFKKTKDTNTDSV